MSTAISRKRTVAIGDVSLEGGQDLPGVRMSYEAWGTLNEAGDNAILISHALTGDSHVEGDVGPDQPTPGWWPGLIGRGKTLDTDKYFVIAPDVLGGCRGSTGPSSIAADGKPWGSSFPHLTVRDQVRAEALLADQLGLRTFEAVIGGSMGGMRALEWAVMYPGRVRRCVAIATSAAATADQIAWATPQLHAIRSDPGFHGGDYYPGPGPGAGLEVARQIAHATYRSAGELQDRFGCNAQEGQSTNRGSRYAVQSYLEHHGRKLVRRFDANAYLTLTEVMNSHDVGRDRGGVQAALRRITAELTVASVSSDRLFTPADGAVIAQAPACSEFATIDSPYGHDGFLIECDQVCELIARALGDSQASAPQITSSQGASSQGSSSHEAVSGDGEAQASPAPAASARVLPTETVAGQRPAWQSF